MKKIFLILLSALSLTAFAQQQKVAVYVTGEQSGITKILGDQLVSAFSQSGEYTAIERTYAFLAELSKEQSYQRTGAVADSDISRLGKQFGVQFVCVADISEAFGEKYISARLINVESAEVTKTANASSKLDSMNELIKVSGSLKNQLIGGSLSSYSSSTSRQMEASYVDLGLPSGTLWKTENEAGGLYTYWEAKQQFGVRYLPTKEQWEELINYCQWDKNGNNFIATGPNGNSVVFNAEGLRDCGQILRSVGESGAYWSSSVQDSETAWYIYWSKYGDYLKPKLTTYYTRCFYYPVRLVK